MKKPHVPHTDANGKKVRQRSKKAKPQSSPNETREFSAPGSEVRK